MEPGVSPMALTASALQVIENTVGDLCRRRSPAHLPDPLRLDYEGEGPRVSGFEERPSGRDPSPWVRLGVARFRCFRSRHSWTREGMRRDLQGPAYPPALPTPDLTA